MGFISNATYALRFVSHVAIEAISDKLDSLSPTTKKTALVAAAIFATMLGGALIGAGTAGLIFSGAIVPIAIGTIIGLGGGAAIGGVILHTSNVANKLLLNRAAIKPPEKKEAEELEDLFEIDE